MILSLILLTCGRPDSVDTIEITVAGAAFTVEVARTIEEQRTGLMYRRSMPEDRGMLFVYPDDRTRDFWMKNTYLPLSIAYISSDGIIEEIYDMEPLSLRTISSKRSVRFALEVNLGAFDRVGATVGSRIEFPGGFR